MLIPEWCVDRRVGALMSTREGGVSRAPYDTLNLGRSVGDDSAAVAENRSRFTAALDGARPKPGMPWLLGDVVLTSGVIAREAKAQRKSLQHHLSHLAVHGVLHLLGYDHEQDRDAEAMEALEIAALAGMGIANPYELGR